MNRLPNRLLALCTLSLATPSAPGQGQIELVKDIHTGAVGGSAAIGSHPTDFVRAGSDVYFVARHATLGFCLWATDDATASLRRIVDTSGAHGGQPSDLTPVGNRLFYVVFAAGQSRLWVTDGSPAGTGPVPNQPQSVHNLLPLGNGVVFAGENAANGAELWHSDGTAAGTRVLDLMPGPASSAAKPVAVANGAVFFTGVDPVAPQAFSLWSANPTNWTANLVRTPMPAQVLDFTSVGTDLYLLTGGSPFGLMRTDGTPGGTVDFPHPGTAWGADRLRLVNGRMLVWAKNPVPLTAPEELWSFDLATQTWQTLTGPSSTPIHGPVVLGGSGVAVFGANLDSAGAELWATDGTPAGTTRLADLRPGPSSSDPREFVIQNQRALFVARRPGNWFELWTTDGTATGTVRVTDAQLFGMPQQLARLTADPLANRVLCVADTPSYGPEPWAFTPPTGGATFGALQLLHDVLAIAGPTIGSLPMFLTDLHGVSLFFADDGTNGHELWRSDGTPNGTRLVLDTTPGPAASSVSEMVVVGGEAMFAARNTLWASDGTPAGTTPRFVMQPAATSVPLLRELTAVGRTLYFMGFDSVRGTELWRSDGTASGTGLVAEAIPGPDAPAAIGMRRWLTAVGDRLFFVVRRLGIAAELWTSDGTSNGTQLVRSFADTSPQSDRLRDLAALGDRLYFFAPASSGIGNELWSSDGTAAGTTIVLGGSPAAPVVGDGAANFVRAGDKLFFDLRLVTGGIEVWATDGSASGTGLVRAASPFAQSDTLKCAVGERLLFLAGLPSWPSAELWVTDGTAANTVPVNGLGTLSVVYPPPLFASGDRHAWFVADPAGGPGLWRIDAAAAQAQRIAATPPNAPANATRFGTVAGGRYLLLTFDAGTTGRELCRIDAGATSHANGVASGDGRRSPRLDPADLALGRLVTFRGYDAPIGALGALGFGSQSPPIPVLGLEWHLGLAGTSALAPFVVQQSDWVQVLQMPSTPVLTDVLVATQAFFLRPSALPAIEASNAAWARIAP